MYPQRWAQCIVVYYPFSIEQVYIVVPCAYPPLRSSKPHPVFLDRASSLQCRIHVRSILAIYQNRSTFAYESFQRSLREVRCQHARCHTKGSSHHNKLKRVFTTHLTMGKTQQRNCPRWINEPRILLRNQDCLESVFLSARLPMRL